MLPPSRPNAAINGRTANRNTERRRRAGFRHGLHSGLPLERLAARTEGLGCSIANGQIATDGQGDRTHHFQRAGSHDRTAGVIVAAA